jgi:hypothetical protein
VITPDPRNIRRPALFPMAKPCRMVSTSSGRLTPAHSHRAYPDRFGNGVTDTAAEHAHVIQNGQVLPAVDGHAHLLTTIPCGAGRR